MAVDDEVLNLELLERSLRRHYQVLTASTPDQALEVLAEEPDVAVILSDYRMPGMTGTELLGETLASHPDTRRVIITGYADNEAVVRAADAGEVDYVIKKPWQRKQLHQLLQQFVQGYELARENRSLSQNLQEVNQELEVRDELYATTVADDRQVLVATAHELQRANRALEEQAYRDRATGLYSRRAFLDRLREEIARAQRHGHSVSLLFGDIDQFAALSHSIGREGGDRALREIACLMTTDEQSRVRESDVVGRLGGEDFGIILVETDRSGAAIKAARLREAVSRAQILDGQQLTISFGIACAPSDGSDPDRLLGNAQRALAVAKLAGRNRQALYTPPSADDGSLYGDTHSRGGSGATPTIPVIGIGAFRPSHSCAGEIGRFLEREHSLSAIYIDMSPIDALRCLLGRSWQARIHERVGDALDAMLEERLDARDIVCRSTPPGIDGSGFLCLLAPPGIARGKHTRTGDNFRRSPRELAAGIALALSRLVAGDTPRHLRELARPTAVAVSAWAGRDGDNRLDTARTVRRIERLGREQARRTLTERLRERAESVAALLADGLYTPRYQPIVTIESGDIMGYRATLHEPGNDSPELGHNLAFLAELTTDGERRHTFDPELRSAIGRALMRRALSSAQNLDPRHKLFVDVHPRLLYDREFMQTRIDEFSLLGAATASNLVLSIPETWALEHFTELRRALAVFGSHGFGVAIREVGRNSDLQALLLLEPQFFELASELVHGMSRTRGKREIVRVLVGMMHTVNAQAIAPAVAEPDDLSALHGVGVPHVRGSFLGRPSAPFARLKPAVKRTLDAMRHGPAGPTPAHPSEPATDE